MLDEQDSRAGVRRRLVMDGDKGKAVMSMVREILVTGNAFWNVEDQLRRELYYEMSE